MREKSPQAGRGRVARMREAWKRFNAPSGMPYAEYPFKSLNKRD